MLSKKGKEKKKKSRILEAKNSYENDKKHGYKMRPLLNHDVF